MTQLPDLSTEDVTAENIRRLFRAIDRPFLVARDLADAFDMTQGNANYHLDKLVESGTICQEKVGAAAVVYWFPESTPSATSQDTEAAI